MTPYETARVIEAIKALDRAELIDLRNHPEQEVESVKAARAILADLVKMEGNMAPAGTFPAAG